MNRRWVINCIFVILVVLGICKYNYIIDLLERFIKNLNEPLNVSLYTLFVTLVSVALTHYFSLKQDKDKYERERLQALYIPLIKNIIGYYDIKTNWRRGHDICDDVSESDIEKDIISHVSKNIKYSSSKLLSEFVIINSHDYFEDMKGDVFQIDFIRFCKVILEDILKLNRRCTVFNRKVDKLIFKYYRKYSIYSIVATIVDNDQQATEFISWEWNFKKINNGLFWSIKFINLFLTKINKPEMVISYIVKVVSASDEDKKNYYSILYD